MQPWIEKGSGSTSQSSLHYDQSLSNIQKQQQQSSSSHGFRTSQSQRDVYNEQEPTIIHREIPHLQNQVLDGSHVLSFLNSTNYTDQVYEEDMRPTSVSYQSYRHQIDHQTGLSKFWKGLMSSDDVVNYLSGETYIDDIYGIPAAIKQDIESLKYEGDKKKNAVNRLNMIRHHFLQKTQGDKDLAAQQAMTHNDWSRNFFDSF